MPNGIFGQLPPGLRGYVAGEDVANRRGMNEFEMRKGIFALQQAAETQPLQHELLRAQVEQARNPTAIRQDVGNEILLLHPRTNAVLNRIPKVATPDAELRQRGEAERHQIPSGSAMLGSQTAIRGQDIRAQTAARGTERPYYTPVPTPEGVFSFNNRTGGMAPIAVGGKPVVRSSDSPALQSDLSYGKRAASEGANADLDQHEAALSAQENLSRINDLLSHLKGSQAITGLGAEVFKNVERAKVMVLNGEKAGKKVSDTELLDAMMGQDVFPMIKSLGIGARGLDTPAEREFLRQVMSGTIQLNRQTLIRLTEMRQDIAQRALDRWNRRVEAGELERFFSSTGRSRGRLEAPRGRRNTDKGSVLEEADRIIGR